MTLISEINSDKAGNVSYAANYQIIYFLMLSFPEVVSILLDTCQYNGKITIKNPDI